MRPLLAIALTSMIGLTSCQPSRYRIFAASQNGETRFSVSDRERDSALGARADRFTVRDADAIMWDIAFDDSCRSSNIGRPFPLVYGHLPECYREVAPAQPLAPNQLYLAIGDGPRDGDGYFSLGPPVQNFTRDEVLERVRGWPDLSRDAR